MRVQTTPQRLLEECGVQEVGVAACPCPLIPAASVSLDQNFAVADLDIGNLLAVKHRPENPFERGVIMLEKRTDPPKDTLPPLLKYPI